MYEIDRSCFRKRRSGQFSSVPWRATGTVASWASRPVDVLSGPARPGPPPHRAPPRANPPVVCPGFGLGKCWQVHGSLCVDLHPFMISFLLCENAHKASDHSSERGEIGVLVLVHRHVSAGSKFPDMPSMKRVYEYTCRVQNPDIPRAGRVRAAHGGAAGPSRTGRRRIGPPRGRTSLLPSRVPKTTVLNVSSEARTIKFRCKPTEEQNPRLTTGLSAVHPRFISGLSPGPRALFVPGC